MRRKAIGTVGGIVALLLSGALAIAATQPGAPAMPHKMTGAMGKMKPSANGHGKKGAAMAGAHAMASVTGPVKGTPSGSTFVIARKGGTVTVDAAGARVRENGKFASVSAIKGGTMVTAKGTMAGTTLKAQEITVHSRGKKGSAGGAMMKDGKGKMSPKGASTARKK